MSVIKKFKQNRHGRDFVIGDIHGCFDLVIAAMRKAGFDRQHDRLFSVGDLVDRGADSARCVAFLSQPYVYAVRGNHEDMFLQLYAKGSPSEDELRAVCRYNGMEWWLGESEETRQSVLAAFRKLPLAIEIETQRGSVGIVHADVPKGLAWPDFLVSLESGHEDALQSCLWRRSRVESRDQSGVAGVGRVLVGHTPQWGGVQRLGNVYPVDTGAVFGAMRIKEQGCLSFMDIVTSTSVLLSPRSDAVSLIDVRTGTTQRDAPFSC